MATSRTALGLVSSVLVLTLVSGCGDSSNVSVSAEADTANVSAVKASESLVVAGSDSSRWDVEDASKWTATLEHLQPHGDATQLPIDRWLSQAKFVGVANVAAVGIEKVSSAEYGVTYNEPGSPKTIDIPVLRIDLDFGARGTRFVRWIIGVNADDAAATLIRLAPPVGTQVVVASSSGRTNAELGAELLGFAVSDGSVALFSGGAVSLPTGESKPTFEKLKSLAVNR